MRCLQQESRECGTACSLLIKKEYYFLVEKLQPNATNVNNSLEQSSDLLTSLCNNPWGLGQFSEKAIVKSSKVCDLTLKTPFKKQHIVV